jgi:hypothetical protein
MLRHRKKPEPKPLPVEGWPRPYMRDGVPGLPIERQEEMLAALGLDLSDDKIYVDQLSRKKIAAHAPLPERDYAVDPPHFGETVYVAGLRVLGWDHLDVLRATAKAFAEQCRIYCADTGAVYSANTPAEEMVNALARAEEARRRARTSRALEGQLSARAARLKAGLAIARPEWPGLLTVAEIEKMSKLNRRTLYTHLGDRKAAREKEARKNDHA